MAEIKEAVKIGKVGGGRNDCSPKRDSRKKRKIWLSPSRNEPAILVALFVDWWYKYAEKSVNECGLLVLTEGGEYYELDNRS
jgi:hypothetical protein